MALPIKIIFVQFTICLLLASCSGTKHLPRGEKLYTGAGINLESPVHIGHHKKKVLKSIAENAVRPNPNKKIVGLRPRLWMNIKAGENPHGKLKKWLKKNGEAPVFISSIKPAVTAAIIDARFFNIGIFNSYTEFKIIAKQHTSNIIFTISISINSRTVSVSVVPLSLILIARCPDVSTKTIIAIAFNATGLSIQTQHKKA